MALGKSPKKIAEYFLRTASDSGTSLTPMQVLKLVYIAHGWFLGLTHKPLINELIEAWQYGPVVPSVYHSYKRFGGGFIREAPSTLPDLEPDEVAVLGQVWEGYGWRSGVSLSSLTHEPGTPWSVTVQQSGIGAVISNDLIEDYYQRQAMNDRGR